MAVAPKQNAVEILRKLIPLNTLGEEELRQLLDHASFEKLKKGTKLFSAGDTLNENVYLLSGKVALLSGREEVDTVSAGSNPARFPIAHQIPRKLTAVAGPRTEIVRVDNRRLGELIAKANSSAYEVAEVDTDAPEDWMSQLLQLRVFQQIPPANIQRVIMAMREVEVEQGDVVLRQGEKGDYFYLVNAGHCSVTRTSEESGEEVEVATLGPGECFGEEALLSDRPRACSVSMLTDGILQRLPKDEFITLVQQPLAGQVDFPEAEKAVEKGSVWLDVRTQQAYEEEHLPGSINLPLASLRLTPTSTTSSVARMAGRAPPPPTC